jgi:hypothetical protein
MRREFVSGNGWVFVNLILSSLTGHRFESYLKRKPQLSGSGLGDDDPPHI